MLESGFFTAALALVGIVPAHPLQIDRSRDLALIPVDPVARSTTAASPQPGVGSMPAASNLGLNAIKREPQVFKHVRTRIPLPPADTATFVEWLRANDELGELSKRRLLTLYAEFCESTFEPVSTGRLMRQLGEQGVLKRRVPVKVVNGKYHSPTVYRVLPIEQERAAA